MPVAVEFEPTVCPLCGSDDARLKYTLEDYYTRQPGQFTLVQCEQCGLVYLNPRPTVQSIRVYYPETYEPHATPVQGSAKLRRWLQEYGWRKRCQPLIAGSQHGRVLDVGCGNGQFLAAMKRYGDWEGVGIDLNPEVVEYVRNTLKIEAYAGELKDARLPDQTFDAVTLWDTLEHVFDPYSTLIEAARLLKPSGVLLLRVPTLDSLDARFFGRYYAGLDSPRHLTVFSRQTLQRILTEAGFSIVRMWNMSGSHASFVLSLRYRLQRHLLPMRSELRFFAIMRSPLGNILSAPFFFLIDKLGLGPEVTVLARKVHHDD